MGTAAELLKDLQAVNVEQVAKDSITATLPDYTEANRRQMLEGKGKDRNIGRYRNPQYAAFKSQLNPKPGRGNVDLKLTGSFQDKMKAVLTGSDIDVSSSDNKESGLIEKYGGQIYGLNVKSQDEYNQESFLPQLFQNIEKLTGLKAV